MAENLFILSIRHSGSVEVEEVSPDEEVVCVWYGNAIPRGGGLHKWRGFQSGSRVRPSSSFLISKLEEAAEQWDSSK